jgi:DNA repair protein RadD
MAFQDRWYQTGAADALFKSVTESKDNHPIAAIPTAGGKTVILCLFVDRFISANARSKILVLSHVQEIIQQDYKALREFFEYDEEEQEFTDVSQIGIYASKMKRREVRKITCAMIQSVWRKPELFLDYDIILVDECHLIGMEEDSMYRSFLAQMNANYVGLTATHYRRGYGYIHIGENALFNQLCYDLTSMENFNRLTDEGYLCRIIGKKTKLVMETSKLKLLGGEYSTKDMSKKFDRSEITRQAVEEIIAFGNDGNYKRWLIFAIDIKHAENIAHYLREKGITTLVVHSKMEEDRDEALERAKAGEYRALISVNVLSTGYNDPYIDLIATLRPTKSPILHVQGPGRGLRPVYADGYDLTTIEGRLAAQANGPKPHCLYLDFAGNSRRLGPINDVYIKQKDDDGDGAGGPMVKYCEQCGTENHLSAKVCCQCGAEFEFKEKITTSADKESDIVRETPKLFKGPQWFSVEAVDYSVKTITSKNGISIKTLLVTYSCEGNKTLREQVNLDHGGEARIYANHWVRRNMRDDIEVPFPRNVDELYKATPFLKIPYSLLVDESKKYPQFLERKFFEDLVDES